MLILLSPAKSLDMTPAPVGLPLTLPELADAVRELLPVAKRLTVADLRRLMAISERLAQLNHDRFQAFDPALEDGLQAVMLFKGDVYLGLDARSLEKEDLVWAQDHLRILSGLYGLLRPLDAVQPYRLEMGTRIKTSRGRTLYDFWGDRLAKGLNTTLNGHADPVLVNLASQEYFGGVDARALKVPVVTCHFKEDKAGALRVLSFYAKRARGLMARFIIQNRLTARADLREFTLGGYRFRRDLSSETDWVFARPQPQGLET